MKRPETRGDILVVDDEENIRSLLKLTLEEAGYKVDSASNGLEAVQKMSERGFDLVLLDIKMPGMDGIQALCKITIDWPHTAVIILTVVADIDTATKAMKLGAYDYLTKPFRLDDVLLAVQRATQRKSSRVTGKQYQHELERKIDEQAGQLRQQLAELLNALAREHKLLYELEKLQTSKGGKARVSNLPQELQKPMSSVEEFREALLRFAKRVCGDKGKVSNDEASSSEGGVPCS